MSSPTKISASVVSLTCKVTDGFGTEKQNLIDYYNDHNNHKNKIIYMYIMLYIGTYSLQKGRECPFH